MRITAPIDGDREEVSPPACTTDATDPRQASPAIPVPHMMFIFGRPYGDPIVGSGGSGVTGSPGGDTP